MSNSKGPGVHIIHPPGPHSARTSSGESDDDSTGYDPADSGSVLGSGLSEREQHQAELESAAQAHYTSHQLTQNWVGYQGPQAKAAAIEKHNAGYANLPESHKAFWRAKATGGNLVPGYKDPSNGEALAVRPAGSDADHDPATDKPPAHDKHGRPAPYSEVTPYSQSALHPAGLVTRGLDGRISPSQVPGPTGAAAALAAAPTHVSSFASNGAPGSASSAPAQPAATGFPPGLRTPMAGGTRPGFYGKVGPATPTDTAGTDANGNRNILTASGGRVTIPASQPQAAPDETFGASNGRRTGITVNGHEQVAVGTGPDGHTKFEEGQSAPLALGTNVSPAPPPAASPAAQPAAASSGRVALGTNGQQHDVDGLTHAIMNDDAPGFAAAMTPPAASPPSGGTTSPASTPAAIAPAGSTGMLSLASGGNYPPATAPSSTTSTPAGPGGMLTATSTPSTSASNSLSLSTGQTRPASDGPLASTAGATSGPDALPSSLLKPAPADPLSGGTGSVASAIPGNAAAQNPPTAAGAATSGQIDHSQDAMNASSALLGGDHDGFKAIIAHPNVPTSAQTTSPTAPAGGPKPSGGASSTPASPTSAASPDPTKAGGSSSVANWLPSFLDKQPGGGASPQASTPPTPLVAAASGGATANPDQPRAAGTGASGWMQDFTKRKAVAA